MGHCSPRYSPTRRRARADFQPGSASEKVKDGCRLLPDRSCRGAPARIATGHRVPEVLAHRGDRCRSCHSSTDNRLPAGCRSGHGAAVGVGHEVARRQIATQSVMVLFTGISARRGSYERLALGAPRGHGHDDLPSTPSCDHIRTDGDCDAVLSSGARGLGASSFLVVQPREDAGARYEREMSVRRAYESRCTGPSRDSVRGLPKFEA